jgi:mono/diheme cytochrome c family protein
VWFFVFLAGIVAPVAAVAQEPTVNDRFFEARIRPVLIERCVKCHGPKKQEMGLRLDGPDGVARGSEAGLVVVAGDVEASTLIEAVRYGGATKMPPEGRLPDAVVADFESWVKQGASWPSQQAAASAPKLEDPRSHWAFQRVNAQAPPKFDAAFWGRSPIDSFIYSKQLQAGVSPSPAADRPTLLRRVTFDLLGLPPSPGEVEAFVADEAPGEVAFAKVVDRLLANPRYGERWGRHWLDVARYADTKGYVFLEEANYPWAYTYRDYVVRAWNADLPYDQFLIEQLAADRLDQYDDQRPLAALGFLTVGGRFMNNPHDILDDRIDVVTRGLMGLTVTCARCHDHKFDPVSQQDYYALYGVFASSVEPPVPPTFEPTADTDEYRAFAAELSARESKLAEFIRAKHTELVHSARDRMDEYLRFAHEHRAQPTTEEFMQIADASDLNPVVIGRWRAALDRMRRLHDPVFAPWFALEEIESANFEHVAQETLAQLQVEPQRPINPLVAKALTSARPPTLADAARVYRDLLHANDAVVDDFSRRADLEHRNERTHPDAARADLWRVSHGPDAPSDVPFNPEGDLGLLPDRPSQETLKQLRTAVEQWRVSGPGAPPRAMTLVDLATPVEPRVFLRGNPNRPGASVPRRVPEILCVGTPEPFQTGSGRLELARAIVASDNPLTARVLVNRVWMHHFGTPLVATPSDFGLRTPSCSTGLRIGLWLMVGRSSHCTDVCCSH